MKYSETLMSELFTPAVPDSSLGYQVAGEVQARFGSDVSACDARDLSLLRGEAAGLPPLESALQAFPEIDL